MLNSQDYYPFGMVMPGRSYQGSDGYRYGFNGMEQDDEVKGDGNSYTTEFRQFDPRLGKWLSIDPLFASFPWQTPYATFDNNPILLNDPTGLAATGPKGDEAESDEEESDKEESDEEILRTEESMLEEVTITVKDPNNPENWSSEADRYSFNGTRADWMRLYGNPGDYTSKDLINHRNSVKQADTEEKDRLNVQKLSFFIEGFTTAGSMSTGALGSFNLASPKGFNFTPRGVGPNSSSLLQSMGFKYLTSLDEVVGVPGVYHFNHALRNNLGYTGQSGNMGVRLTSHFNQGNIGEGGIWFKPMLNSSRTAREIFETTTILRFGNGSLRNTANLRFPVSRTRASLLDLEIYGIYLL